MSNKPKPVEENISFSLVGLKFSCSNPGNRTITIILALLVFIIIMTLLLKTYVLSAIVVSKGKSIVSGLGMKIAGWVHNK